jgi:hypothetical protein
MAPPDSDYYSQILNQPNPGSNSTFTQSISKAATFASMRR